MIFRGHSIKQERCRMTRKHSERFHRQYLQSDAVTQGSEVEWTGIQMKCNLNECVSYFELLVAERKSQIPGAYTEF
jgi:hypothetical protein